MGTDVPVETPGAQGWKLRLPPSTLSQNGKGLWGQAKGSQDSGDKLAGHLFNVCASFPNDVLVKLFEDGNRN